MSIQDLLENFQNKKVNKISVKTLMESIINSYVLVVNDEKYDFCEIELYYYKKQEHEDCRVLKRDKKAGDIFFHRFGFDICFATDKNTYGGILVRSLKKDGIYILGPWDCKYKLLNKYQPEIKISIEKKQEKNKLIDNTVRIKSSCKDNRYNQCLYRSITKEANDNEDNKTYLSKINKYSKN